MVRVANKVVSEQFLRGNRLLFFILEVCLNQCIRDAVRAGHRVEILIRPRLTIFDIMFLRYRMVMYEIFEPGFLMGGEFAELYTATSNHK
jgi:hypothetical protein